jgi:predicted membrane-bound spermidine synthase
MANIKPTYRGTSMTTTKQTAKRRTQTKLPANVLYQKKSPFQLIQLTKNRGGFLLKLNGSPQVHSKEEALYHECIATLPMMLADKVNEVVILGGGDGLAARNILQFPKIKNVTLIELDGGVLDLCSKYKTLAEMNEGALRNPRLKVIEGDAINWFLKSTKKFDVIVHDIENIFTDQPREISAACYRSFYQAIYDKLTPGGVWVTTLDDDDESIETLEHIFDSIQDELPEKTRRDFKRARDYIGKGRALLSFLFPYVRAWTVDFPILGSHTSFYMSKTPRNRMLRWPSPIPKHIGQNILSTVR